MRRSVLVFTAVLMALSLCLANAQSGSSSGASDRKITSRVPPVLPDLARRMHIHGIVRVEAIVRPNGTVKATRVLGGNPVLVEAALEAVGKWKFEAGPNETTEVVQVSFED